MCQSSPADESPLLPSLPAWRSTTRVLVGDGTRGHMSAPASSWWLLRSLAAGMAAQVFAAPPCEDKGPWPCTEDGCPAPEISCAMLKGECGSVFKNVWSPPPAGVANDLVWVHCPATCGKCGEQAPAAAPAPVPGKWHLAHVPPHSPYP